MNMHNIVEFLYLFNRIKSKRFCLNMYNHMDFCAVMKDLSRCSQTEIFI